MSNEVIYTLGEEVIDHYIEKKSYFLSENNIINDENSKISKCEEIISLITLCYVLSEKFESRKNKYIRYSIYYLEMLINYLDSCNEYKVKQYGYTGLGYCLNNLADKEIKFGDFKVAVNEVIFSMLGDMIRGKTEALSEEEIVNMLIITEYLLSNNINERTKLVGEQAKEKLKELYERRRVELSDNTLLKLIHSVVFKWGYKPVRFSKVYMVRDVERIAKKELSHEEILMMADIYSAILKGKDFAEIKFAEKKKYKKTILDKWTDVEISYKEMLVFITTILDNKAVLSKLKGYA